MEEPGLRFRLQRETAEAIWIAGSYTIQGYTAPAVWRVVVEELCVRFMLQREDRGRRVVQGANKAAQSEGTVLLPSGESKWRSSVCVLCSRGHRGYTVQGHTAPALFFL